MLSVRKDPIAFQRAADRAAFAAEFLDTAIAETLAVTTNDLQTQCHIGPSI
jgi:hypothetical protein